MAELRDELLAETTTPAEVENVLSTQSNDIGGTLVRFYGHYLYSVFNRVYFEHLVQKVGDAKAESFMKDIKDFITATLKNRTTNRDISRLDWRGPEGQALTADIMETTMAVFGVDHEG